MCKSNPEKIIAVTGKTSQMISQILVKALKNCSNGEEISVAWGCINEIMDASSNVNISLLIAEDFDEQMTSEFSDNITEVVAPYREECIYKKLAPAGCTVSQYAVDENCADIVAKNVVRAETHTSFELLAVSKIGRLRFEESDITTVDNMLASAAVLLAAGIDFNNVITGLNKIRG